MAVNENQLKRILLGRFALNLYFWIGFLFIPGLMSLSNFGHGEEHYQINFRAQALFAIFYSIIIYFNNLVLLPSLFQRRRYITYFVVVASLVSVWAVLQAKYDYLFYGCKCLLPITGDRFAIAGFQIAAFVMAFAAIKLIRDYLRREDEFRELDKIRLQNELNFLKSQINPHFLFNTLNSLYSFALEKSDKVPEFILRLSEMMRYMLYECNEELVTLDKEIKYLRSYVELQAIRMEERGQVSFEVQGETSDLSIAPFLLINFVENSFKHSQDNQVNDIFIKIELKVDDNKLSFSTANNTSATKDEALPGIGLNNVKQRLEFLYPQRYTLDLRSNGHMFTTNLILHLEPHEVHLLDS